MDRPGDPEWPKGPWQKRPTIRTQRTALQSALLAHVPPGTIQLSKKLVRMTHLAGAGAGSKGAVAPAVELTFADGTVTTADLVVGADGIRSVVRDAAWPNYEIAFTGTTIWRALLPLAELVAQDERFAQTGWWHLPESHVYFSPVGEGLGEIAARETQDPQVYGANKVVWGVPVTNEHVESHFKVQISRFFTSFFPFSLSLSLFFLFVPFWQSVTDEYGFLLSFAMLTRGAMSCFVGLPPPDPNRAPKDPRRGLARVCRLCRPRAGAAHGVGQQGDPSGRLVARAVGGVWVRGRVRHGGWVGARAGAATLW